MTTKQIEKKFAKAGLKFNAGEVDILGGDIVVCVGYEERINGFGYCNETKTRALAKKVANALGWDFNYIKTGYGAIILQDKPLPAMGDYNDKTSRWHY